MVSEFTLTNIHIHYSPSHINQAHWEVNQVKDLV